MAISLVSGDVDLGAGTLGVTSVTFSNITPISGNLLVVCVSNQTGGQTWPTAPSGWNYVIAGDTGGNFQSVMLYKISDGTETGCDLGDIGAGVSKLVALQFTGNAASGVLDDAEQDVTNYTTGTQTCSTGTATATQADGAAVSFTSWEDQRSAEAGSHSLSNGFTILSDADPSNFPNTSTTYPHPVVGFLAYASTGNYSTTDTTTDTGDENYGIIALFKAASAGAPTITALSAINITATSAQPQITYA